MEEWALSNPCQSFEIECLEIKDLATFRGVAAKDPVLWLISIPDRKTAIRPERWLAKNKPPGARTLPSASDSVNELCQAACAEVEL